MLKLAKILPAALLAFGVVVSTSTVVLADPIIVNGSFELGVDPNTSTNGFSTVGVGSTDITGWSVGGHGVDYIGSYWTAADGVRSLDLNALDVGSVSQTFDTVIGQKYDVSFSLAANPDSLFPTPRTLVAAAVGSQSFSFTPSPAYNHTNMGWTTKSFSFIATSLSSTLSFTSTSTGDSQVPGYPNAVGPALDNVVVTAVPLPPAALAGAGLLSAMGVYRRLKRVRA